MNNERDLPGLLTQSFQDAKSTSVEVGPPGTTHRKRSQNWVEVLANNFRKVYPIERGFRVLSRGYRDHPSEFGLNELLYDIVVCRVGTVAAPVHKTKLVYISEVCWQIESEFARDSKKALLDFNKLVLGSAHNKLFIGPRVNNVSRFIETFRPAARACTGNVYLALIPHPREWETPEQECRVDVWNYVDDQWKSLRQREDG